MQSISTEFQIGLTPQEKRSELVVKTQDRNSVRLEFSILNAIVDTVWVLITGRQLSIELPCTKENDIWIVNFDHTWITTPDELTAHLYGSIGTINTINYKRYDIGSVSFSVDISAIDSNLHETKIYYFEQVEDLINGLDARYIQSEQIRQNEFEEVEEARQAAEIIRHDYYENFKSRAESGEFNGLSAYEIALKYGFVGTEQAWNDAVNQNRMVRFGTGSPEGVITAQVGTEYTDTAVTNGAAKWIKNSGTGNTGWIVTVGDTGWRNVSSLRPNGWAGSLYIRRTAQAVEILAEALSPTTVPFTLPLGFRPAINTRWAFSTTDTPPVFHRFLAAKSGGSLQYIGAIPQSISLYGSQMASADLSSWPTTLPGISY